MADPSVPVVDSKTSSDCADTVPVDAKQGAVKPEAAKANKNEGKGKSGGGGGGGKGKKPAASASLPPPPAWVEDRVKIWDEYKKKQDEHIKSMLIYQIISK